MLAQELSIGSVMVGLLDPDIIRKEFEYLNSIEPTALLLLGISQKALSPDRHSRRERPSVKL